MAIKQLKDVDCAGKTVVIRQDLNVPMKDGHITNDKRIRAARPGIQMALEKGAGVILLSHLGRPTEGEFDPKFSLAPVAEHLSGLLGKPVRLAKTLEEAKVAPGDVVLLENIRFFKGEKKNDPDLAARLAGYGAVLGGLVGIFIIVMLPIGILTSYILWKKGIIQVVDKTEA